MIEHTLFYAAFLRPAHGIDARTLHHGGPVRGARRTILDARSEARRARGRR